MLVLWMFVLNFYSIRKFTAFGVYWDSLGTEVGSTLDLNAWVNAKIAMSTKTKGNFILILIN